MPNEVKFLNVEPGGHLHRRSSMVHGGSFLLDSASYGAAVAAPAIARKRSARFASMVAKCEETVRDATDEIVASDVCCHSPWRAISRFIVEKMRFDCGWPPGILLLLAIFS
jgi:hypothetical protein